MKFTKEQVVRIIKEELELVMEQQNKKATKNQDNEAKQEAEKQKED